MIKLRSKHLTLPITPHLLIVHLKVHRSRLSIQFLPGAQLLCFSQTARCRHPHSPQVPHRALSSLRNRVLEMCRKRGFIARSSSSLRARMALLPPGLPALLLLHPVAATINPLAIASNPPEIVFTQTVMAFNPLATGFSPVTTILKMDKVTGSSGLATSSTALASPSPRDVRLKMAKMPK